ncbi:MULTISPECIES: entericidin A/B family lipoprotein [unclassified Marinobacter]|nr:MULTISPECIES: entericidin A/B family lipoprotein [unclassified Marinobacter]PFG09516.1 entericidin B [Marinobacter sp. LV10MA510-1]PFG51422.1 entericidin B [Marinobacter sp. LV10R520-4]
MKILNASILLMVLALAGGLSGCNTTAGVGQDIEAAGGAIEGAAEDASN